jgi:hypothetical protein
VNIGKTKAHSIRKRFPSREENFFLILEVANLHPRKAHRRLQSVRKITCSEKRTP